MTSDVEYLVLEIRDLLRAGRVGLYEFTEVLRDRHPSASAAELEPTSRAALDVLLADAEISLGTYRWTEPGFRVNASGVIPKSGDFETPPQEVFLAVEFVD